MDEALSNLTQMLHEMHGGGTTRRARILLRHLRAMRQAKRALAAIAIRTAP